MVRLYREAGSRVVTIAGDTDLPGVYAIDICYDTDYWQILDRVVDIDLNGARWYTQTCGPDCIKSGCALAWFTCETEFVWYDADYGMRFELATASYWHLT